MSMATHGLWQQVKESVLIYRINLAQVAERTHLVQIVKRRKVGHHGVGLVDGKEIHCCGGGSTVLGCF